MNDAGPGGVELSNTKAKAISKRTQFPVVIRKQTKPVCVILKHRKLEHFSVNAN